MITIYGLTNEHGQIWYIGQTASPRERFYTHRSTKSHCKLSGMAVLGSVTTRKEANEAEQRWIAFFGQDNLTNKASKGQIGQRDSNLVYAALRLPANMMKRIEQIAKRDGSTFSQFMRTAAIKEVNERKKVAA